MDSCLRATSSFGSSCFATGSYSKELGSEWEGVGRTASYREAYQLSSFDRAGQLVVLASGV